MFTFPGLWPYIELAAEGRDLRHLGRSRDLWHYKQVQDSLGQLPGLEADARLEALRHVAEVRAALAAAIEGIDLAVRDSAKSLGIAAPLIAAATAPADPIASDSRRAASPRRRRD